MKFKTLGSRKEKKVAKCHDSNTGQLAPAGYQGEDSAGAVISTRPYGGVDYKKTGPKHD